MSRQVLTFLIVFAGLMLLMRSCSGKANLPPALTASRPEPVQEADLVRLVDEDKDLVVRLARDGTVVSARLGDTDLIRPVVSYRRPFHLLVNTSDRRTGLPLDAWTAAPVDDRTCRFTGRHERLTVVKTIRLADGGRGLDLELSITGANDDVNDFWMTAIGGVPLTSPDADTQSGAIRTHRGGEMAFVSLGSLIQIRESERTRRLARLKEREEPPARELWTRRELLDADAEINRFGVLGRTHFVTLEDLPHTSALLLDVYRTEREGGDTNEIEGWLELVRRGEGYTGTFRVRWGEREELARSGSTVFQRSSEYRLENHRFRADFTDRGASVRAMWLKDYSTEAGEEPSEETWIPILRDGVRRSERTLTLDGDPDLYGLDPAEAVWETETLEGAIRFTLETPKGWTLVKTVTLPEEGYALVVDVEIRRPEGSGPAAAKYRLVGPAGVYIADAYRGIIGAEPPAGLVLEHSGGDDESERIDSLVEGDQLLRTYSGAARRGLFHVIAVRGAYFVCALVAPDDRAAGTVTQAVASAIRLDRAVERADGDPSRDNLMGRISCEIDVGAGRGQARYLLYCGPNALDPLRGLDIEGTVDFGVFGFIGRPLMWLMKLLQGLAGSFGVAIMLMTLIVRALLMPASYKTQLGMSRYQKRFAKIKPILEELQKKYAKNPQKLNQERMKVMREHKVGLPLGCLTMFLQIPIWISLFSALRVEFALRHEPFLWAADLSMPDRLFPLPFWPHWFNLLPILMLVLWVTQQKFAPKPGGDDPQVQMQMKMMKFMPFMFFFMLYNYAAALAVYMCVSSTWGIFESRYVRKAVATSD